jgi:hypothetical protein
VYERAFFGSPQNQNLNLNHANKPKLCKSYKSARSRKLPDSVPIAPCNIRLVSPNIGGVIDHCRFFIFFAFSGMRKSHVLLSLPTQNRPKRKSIRLSTTIRCVKRVSSTYLAQWESMIPRPKPLRYQRYYPCSSLNDNSYILLHSIKCITTLDC